MKSIFSLIIEKSKIDFDKKSESNIIGLKTNDTLIKLKCKKCNNYKLKLSLESMWD